MGRVTMLCVLVAVGVLASAVALSPVGARQGATPAPTGSTPGALPATPDASECQTDRRLTPEQIGELAATPSASTPSTLVGGAFTQVGDAADAQTVAAITSTLRAFYACVNAGDLAAALALYTDDVVRTLLTDAVLQLGGDQAAADIETLLGTPTPRAAEDQIALIAVRDVLVLDGGQVAATVVDTSPEVVGGTYVVFAPREDGGFLIASPLPAVDLVDLIAGSATPVATPAALTTAP